MFGYHNTVNDAGAHQWKWGLGETQLYAAALRDLKNSLQGHILRESQDSRLCTEKNFRIVQFGAELDFIGKAV